jgi:two-component system phosphate regulon response regulator PhoB
MQASVSVAELSRTAPGAHETVLLVSQEPFVRELMSALLRTAGCLPMAVATLGEGQHLTSQVSPDLVVVDLDGQACESAAWALNRQPLTAAKAVLTVVLTAEHNRLCGRDAAACGAQLCVAKPFEPRELLRQLLKLLRPSEHRLPSAALQAEPSAAAAISLDSRLPCVHLLTPQGWKALELTWTEHRLLAFLLRGVEQAHTREEILDAVWHDTPVDLRTVDQYVRRLRRNLEAAGGRDLVKTVKGFGYRLDTAALSCIRA